MCVYGSPPPLPPPRSPPCSCVPVPILDHAHEPFEPMLDWSTFAVRPAERDIPRLHTLLAGIDEQQYGQLQVRAGQGVAVRQCGAR